jgi:hypothetical protein
MCYFGGFTIEEDLFTGMMVRDSERVCKVKGTLLMERGVRAVHEDVFSSVRFVQNEKEGE